MRKLTLIAVIFIMVTLLSMPLIALAAGSQSITRTFQPSSADSYVNLNDPDAIFGTAEAMYVETKNGRFQRSFVQFDLSSIPTGSTITSATLSLYATASIGRTYGAHRVTATWDETTITWNSPATFDATATASIVSANGWMNWTVTADVQAFIETQTATNYGWCIKDATEGTSAVHNTVFHTRDYTTDTSLCPKLAVAFTPVWDSYSDTARLTQTDIFSGSTDIVYMKGTGFLNGAQTYNVSYYDADGTKIATDSNIALVDVSDGRGTLGNTSEPYEPTYGFTGNPSASPGTWHAVAQPYGATAFPSSYSDLAANPDTYELIADDTCTVNASAIPEFPTVMAAIGVAGLCCGIYFWMRKKYRKVAVRI